MRKNGASDSASQWRGPRSETTRTNHLQALRQARMRSPERPNRYRVHIKMKEPKMTGEAVCLHCGELAARNLPGHKRAGSTPAHVELMWSGSNGLRPPTGVCGSKPASEGAARTTPSSGRQHLREPDGWSTRGAGEIRAASLRSYPTSPTMQTLVCPIASRRRPTGTEVCTGRTLVEVGAPCLCTRLLGRARRGGAPRLVLATNTGATHSPIARMRRLQALDLAVN